MSAQQTDDLVDKAFVVMARTEVDGVARLRQLSRRYQVRQAAEEFARMIRQQGVPDAYVFGVGVRERRR